MGWREDELEMDGGILWRPCFLVKRHLSIGINSYKFVTLQYVCNGRRWRRKYPYTHQLYNCTINFLFQCWKNLLYNTSIKKETETPPHLKTDCHFTEAHLLQSSPFLSDRIKLTSLPSPLSLSSFPCSSRFAVTRWLDLSDGRNSAQGSGGIPIL